MAGRHYAVDDHPQKQEIVKAILKGESFRHIATHFDTPEHKIAFKSIARYTEEVLNKDIAVYLAQQNQQNNLHTIDGCVKELEDIATICKRMIKQAEDDLASQQYTPKDVHSYLKGYLNELRGTVKDIGEFLGIVDSKSAAPIAINVADTQFIFKVISILEDELSDQPEKLQTIEDKLRNG